MKDILRAIAKAHKKLNELEREHGGTLYDIRHALWEAEKEIKRLHAVNEVVYNHPIWGDTHK